MVDLALRMLFGDRAKFAMLVSGVAFATILMTQGFGLFFGMLTFSHATATNIRSPIWVVDPQVQQVGDNQPLRDTDVDRVRSVPGVAWAAPLHVGGAQARLHSGGATQQVTLVGLDANTLAGAPTRVLAGDIRDLRLAQAVIVDARFLALLKSMRRQELRVGDTFEMNDRRALIVGVAELAQGIGGATYVFTTWDRAKDYAPSQRKMLTHILAGPQAGIEVDALCAAITAETGLQALPEQRLKAMSERWMIFYSPIPFVVGIIVVVGFVIGIGVSGQTFYTFVLENTRHLGALKAMGASNLTLSGMIVLQAALVGFIGFGLGVGAMSAVFSALPEGRVPMKLLWPVPVTVLGAVLLICVTAAVLGVVRAARIEPAIVFRA